ncbi:MAG: hypothetical protein KGK30_07870, partial [Elusimicrobia bacterium]|nr:hypothetical protein [Elusimicrobiota bacterium]
MRRASIFLFLCLLGSSASAIATFEALRYEGPTKVYLDSLKEFLTPLSPAQPFLRTLEENPQSAAVLADCFPYSEIEKARALPTPESKLEQWTMMQASVRQRLERDIAESGQLDLESSFLLLDEIHAHYQAYLDEASRAELETAWRKASGEIMDSMLAQADELTRHDPASSDGLPFDIMLSGGRGYGHLAAGLSPAQSRALTDALRHMVAASKFEPTYRERWLEGQPGPGGEELEHTAQASAHTQAAARLKHFFLAALRLHILAARVPGVTTHYEFNSLLQGLGDFPPSTSTEQAMLVRKLLQIIDIVLPYVRNHVMQIGDPGVLAVSAADLEKRVTSLLDISPWVKRSSALAFWLGSMPQRQASLSRSFHEEFPLLKPMAVRAVIAKDYASVREPLRFENNAAGIEDAASPNYAVLSYGDASHPRRARLLTDGIQFITDKDGHRLAVELFTS